MASDETMRASALSWIQKNTTFNTAINPLPDSVEIFIEKYAQIMSLRPGISSENISGLSQSFSSLAIGATLKEYAKDLIGEEFMLSDVKAIPAVDRWVY